MYKKLIIFFATGGYAGYFPAAPGTVGTLWGIPLTLVLVRYDYPVRGILLLLLFFIAVWLSSSASKLLKSKDPSSIVVDEIVGFLTASLFVPTTVVNIVFIFLLFRFFDIVKLFPLGLIDRRIGGGLGIVLDDVMAGIYTIVVFSLTVLLFR
ncbi:MAG: phosphatidylglycerophosphatase A [Thermodesulfobacteriota bacterium]